MCCADVSYSFICIYISKHHLLEDKIMIVFEISHLPRFEAQLQNDPAMATAIIGSYEKINDAR